MRLRTALLLALMVSGTSAAIAQSPLQKTDSLEYLYPMDVVVTAPRVSGPLRDLPFSASVVEQSDPAALPRGIAIDEPLLAVPGVKVDNQANGMRVHLSMRGQGILTERGIRGIRILYDGIPINDPAGFAPDLFDVDFSTVGRVEVFRGTAASLYGGSASGGLINMVSAAPSPAPAAGTAGIAAGSNGFWKGSGQAGGTQGDLNYQLSASRTMGSGYRIHSHFHGDIVYARGSYTPSASFSITPVLGWTNVYHENPEGINLAQLSADPTAANPDAVPFNEYLETRRFTAGFTALFLPNPRHELRLTAHSKTTAFTEANNRTFNHRSIGTPGLSLQYTARAEGEAVRNTLNAGVDLQWQTIDEHRTDNILSVEGDTVRSRERITQRGAGLFLTDRVDLAGRVSLMGSLRFDALGNRLQDELRVPYDLSGSADFSRGSGRLGISWSPRQDLNLYANWGQGFLPPATEELAQNPDGFGGFNRHLTFATSSGFDLGARGVPGDRLYYDIAGFWLTTENDFDRYRIADPLRNQETFYRNAGSSRRLGVEFYARYTPGQALTFQTAYTLSDFRYTNTAPIRVMMDDPTVVKYILDGNLLPNSPRHQLVLDVQYSPMRDFSVGVTSETLSSAQIDGANAPGEAVPGYTLVHARVRFSLKAGGWRGEIGLHARNIGNAKYVAFSEPDPGGNAYQPGPGREFFASFAISI